MNPNYFLIISLQVPIAWLADSSLSIINSSSSLADQISMDGIGAGDSGNPELNM